MRGRNLITLLSIAAATFTNATIAKDRPELKNVSPEIRRWFEEMKSPTGSLCCSFADGHRTEYDIRQGQYWVPIDGEWQAVPPEVVINTPNPVGDAIVWYLQRNADEVAMHGQKWKIYCFVPADGV